MKPVAYYQKKEQTYLKHFFLERYLETVAFHIGYTHQEFVYVDCFSGPWRSPMKNSRTPQSDRTRQTQHVRDGLQESTQRQHPEPSSSRKTRQPFGALDTALQQRRRAIKTTALPGTFEDNIPTILNEVGNAFTFFFIDPKGWTGFAMDHIKPILPTSPARSW